MLTLAADVETVAQVPEPFAFAVTALPDGWAIGTGGEGRVLKVARDGAVSVLFDAPEANVFALFADARRHALRRHLALRQGLSHPPG